MTHFPVFERLVWHECPWKGADDAELRLHSVWVLRGADMRRQGPVGPLVQTRTALVVTGAATVF